ncbi:putative olfactory receptor 52L2 [Centropristis striata]|uniref:putative olfactory receptor 52L2 n=1 Tax=Centropristis striata TaxID=184440 RepID=UPI0027E160C5|nr:putative olfactory receptor 52L2 [Centropristis striata]
MENFTFNSFTLQLEGLKVSKYSMYPVFLFFFFSYLFIMITNVGIVVLIFIDKSLHQPMYLLFCNLPVNDIVGNSIMMPRLLSDILQPPTEHFISYYECVVQAFTSHIFGTCSYTVLMIGLTIRLNRCRTLITNPYCDNPSLFKLSCESVVINNVYGLTFTVILFTGSIGSTVLTYTKITVVCLTSKNKSLNSKALKTCSTHLVVYLVMLIFGFIFLILHRFPHYSEYRKLSAILFHIVLGCLNPVIYGIQSAEIFRSLSKLFRSKKLTPLS